MTKYYKHGVNLTNGQKTKISSAYKKRTNVSIKLSKINLTGNDMLALTQTQINKIKNAKNGVQLNLSASQLRFMVKNRKTGGFLPLLLAAVPAILEGIGGLTAGITSAVNSSKSVGEQKRHNEFMENQFTKSGNGVVSDFAGKIPILGTFIQPLLQKIGLGNNDINKIIKGKCLCKNGFSCKQIGNGLYLEPEGNGLFLGQRRE